MAQVDRARAGPTDPLAAPTEERGGDPRRELEGPVVAIHWLLLTSNFSQDAPLLPRRAWSPIAWSSFLTGSLANPTSDAAFDNPNLPDYSRSGGLAGLVSLDGATQSTLAIPAFDATFQQYGSGGVVRGYSTNLPTAADLLQSEWACGQSCICYVNTMAAAQ